jgi:hypothetical protein
MEGNEMSYTPISREELQRLFEQAARPGDSEED